MSNKRSIILYLHSFSFLHINECSFSFPVTIFVYQMKNASEVYVESYVTVMTFATRVIYVRIGFVNKAVETTMLVTKIKLV